MSEKINVKEFVEGYEKSKNPQLYLKKITINDYVSYGQKTFLAKKIVESSSRDDRGNVRIDSAARYLIYIYTLLNSYTNLDLDSTTMVDDFDLLNRHGLINEIVALIPESETKEFDMILSMAYDDFMTNHYEIHAYVAELIDKISAVINGTSPELLDELRKYLYQNGGIDDE